VDTTKTYRNCTFYRSSDFIGNIIRQDCRDLTVSTEQQYAQYKDAVKVEYTPKGARKQRGFWLTYKPFLVVLDTKDAIDLAAILGDPEPGGSPDVSVQVSQYSSFDDRWETDFLDALESRNIQPLFQLHPEYSVEA
jgi:hypothetical protein